jgi:hypothetical protein
MVRRLATRGGVDRVGRREEVLESLGRTIRETRKVLEQSRNISAQIEQMLRRRSRQTIAR